MKNAYKKILLCAGVLAASLAATASELETQEEPAGHHEIAQRHKETLRFSTLMISRVINNRLSSEEGVREAIDWCRMHGIVKVYLETFRDEEFANRDHIIRARDMFRAAGMDVAGCVTTVGLTKPAMIPLEGELKPDRYLACYTNHGTQEMLQEIFEITASLFDEVIIDDFFCTNCQCEECTTAKGDRSWGEYRTDLMVKVSQERVIAPAKRVNPDVRLTIKYPNFYDHYYGRGYDIERQTELFDAIYTGTESREPSSISSNPQYMGYFIMQWLNAVGGEKNLGGWFDYIMTEPETYVEQARQTVLGQAPEIMLFHYGELSGKNKPKKLVEKLFAETPELFELAELVKGKQARGVVVPKPVNSSDADVPGWRMGQDRYVYGFLGLLGIPVVPSPIVPERPDSILGTRHLIYDQDMLNAFRKVIQRDDVAAAYTGLLASELGEDVGEALVIPYKDKAQLMTNLPTYELSRIRNHLLTPLGVKLSAQPRVALYLYDDDLVVLENFNPDAVDVGIEIIGEKEWTAVLTIPAEEESTVRKKDGEAGLAVKVPGRSLVVLKGE